MKFKLFLTAGIISVMFSCKPVTENQSDSKAAVDTTKIDPHDEFGGFKNCVEVKERDFWKPSSHLTEEYEDCITRHRPLLYGRLNLNVCLDVSLTKLDQEKSRFMNQACFNQFKEYITYDQCYLLVSNTGADRGLNVRNVLAINCLENFKGKMDKVQCERLLPFLSSKSNKYEYQKQCDAI